MIDVLGRKYYIKRSNKNNNSGTVSLLTSSQGLLVIKAIVHSGIPERRLDLMQGLTGVRHMDFASHCTREHACGTTHWNTGAWERTAIAHLAAARRAQLNQLSLTSTKASSALIAATSPVRNLLKHRIVIVENLGLVLHLVHTRIDAKTTPRHPNHLGVVPLYAIFTNEHILAGLPFRRYILSIVTEEAHAEQRTKRRSTAANAAPRGVIAGVQRPKDADLVVSLPRQHASPLHLTLTAIKGQSNGDATT